MITSKQLHEMERRALIRRIKKRFEERATMHDRIVAAIIALDGLHEITQNSSTAESKRYYSHVRQFLHSLKRGG
jgi:hypothetical protein